MAQINLPCAADAYVYTYSSTDQATNYGTNEILYVQAFCQSYVQFSLANIPAGSTSINSAILNLTSDSTGNTATGGPSTEDWTYVYRVDSAWNEASVTYTNRPVRGSLYQTWNYNGSSYQAQYGAQMPQYSVFSIDVTELVRYWFNGGANYGLLMKALLYPEDGNALNNPSNGSFSFYSRNSGYSPTLTVDYTIPPKEGTATFTGKATTSSTSLRVRETSSASTGTVTASLVPASIRAGKETITGRSTASIVPVRVISVAQQATGTASITAGSSRLVGGTLALTARADVAFESLPQKDGTLSATGLSSFTASGNQITGNRSASMTATGTTSWDTTRLIDTAATCNAALFTTMSPERATQGIMAAVGSAGIEGGGVRIMVADVAFVGRAAPSISLLVYHWAELEKPPNPWRYKL